MEDYVKRQIDMIGQMLLALAKKLGFIDGNAVSYSMQSVQDEIVEKGFNMDIDRALAEEHPVAYLVESLQLSNEAIETFTEIVMNSDADNKIKQRLLNDAVNYLDSKGYFSFSLHSYLS